MSTLFLEYFNSRKHYVLMLLLSLLILPKSVAAQSLFDSATSDNKNEELNYSIGGYFMSGIFADEKDFKSIYAEGALKLDISGSNIGSAFAELRYRESDCDNDDNSFLLREGYVDLSLNKFDFRIGQQIIVWGRADGFNPTNNITPADYTVFSPDEDKKRLSNFVFKSVYNIYPVKVEFDWIPVYEASVLPFGNAELPDGVNWINAGELNPSWKNSSFGLKIDIEKPSFDGSFSYFNGYHKLPGILYTASENSYGIYTRPYRTQVFGADFSTVLGSYGLRGEFAYSVPNDEPDSSFSVPCKQLEYTLGVDSEWNNFSLIVQYIGKHIFDFNSQNLSQNTLIKEVTKWNKMLFSQQEEWNHSVSVRPSLNLFYETLILEMLGLANFSTEEIYLQPKATYKLADAYELIVGAVLYYGPDDTLHGYLEKSRNSGFAELKISF
ncbi:MAG: hypothetical protein PVH88_18245 [Ignavibacteria bacterium]|jgi:hypothetical protein